MDFISSLWFEGLYQPLFNALIWIYLNIAGENMGWAVIWLTIFLRVLLLPLTIISERNALHHGQAVREAEAAMNAFRMDRVAQQEAARGVMRKHRISPWAKVLTLAIQGLVLVLLYQVFIRGITGERILTLLYPFIDFPGRINTFFYGFDIGRTHDYIWSGLAAAYLFVSILFENRGKEKWVRGDMYFLIFFPLATFIVLLLLPMVKSLFILTTMAFSDIIKLIRHMFFGPKKAIPVKARH